MTLTVTTLMDSLTHIKGTEHAYSNRTVGYLRAVKNLENILSYEKR